MSIPPNAKIASINRSEHFLVTIKSNGQEYKVLRIQFYGNGSIFVESPWFMSFDGLVSVAKYPANNQNKGTLDLGECGYVTSHLAKYSHPPDGNAHFSQDEKILTVMRKATPFIDIRGHMFSATIQNLEHFEKLNGVPKKKYHHISFSVDTAPKDTSLKIVGNIHNLNEIAGLAFRGEGKREPQFLSAPTGKKSDDFTLILSCKDSVPLNQDGNPVFLLIGGFDHLDVINDLSKDTEMLVMSYPARDKEELLKRLKSIDFRKPA